MGRIDPVRDLVRRLSWWSSGAEGLTVLFVVGLLLRLLLAWRSQGFPFDIASFTAWADTLGRVGPGRFYEQTSFADYPPGYLYILYAIGKLGPGTPSAFVLKLPAIAADLGVAWLAVVLARRLTPLALRRRMPVSGPVAAAVLLNPAIFFVSAVWGQVDSILAFWVLASLTLLATQEVSLRREAAGMALLAVAVATKPQAAFALPMVVLVLAWRHLRGVLAEHPGAPRLRTALPGIGRIAFLGAVPVVVGLALLAPFGLGLRFTDGFGFDLTAPFDFYLGAAGTYEVTSVFAFNFWGIAGFWKPDSGSEAVRLLGIPAVWIGLTLFVGLAMAVLVRAWRALDEGEHEGRVLVFGAAALTLVAFVSLTRIHDRYLFMALAGLTVFVGFRWLRASLAALSVLYVVNVYFPYVYYLEYENLSAPRVPFFDALYGGGLSSPQLKLVSFVTAMTCLVVAWRGWTWIAARSGDDAAVGGEPPPADARAGHDGPVPVAVRPEAGPDGVDEAEPPSRREPFALRTFALGRRGVVVGGVVFVLALATRLPGLASPPGMYFDEVYHARTAGEYLEGREVYEWTHPPLAKELMALSVSAFSGFGVHGEAEAPGGLVGGLAASAAGEAVWVRPAGTSSGLLHRGTFGRACGIDAAAEPVPVGAHPAAVVATPTATYVGGTGEEGPVVVRVLGTDEVWRATLPAAPTQLAVAGSAVFVRTDDGSLHRIGDDGVSEPIATGVGTLAAGGRATVWASFPDEHQLVSFDPDGTSSATVPLDGEPRAIVAPPDTNRVLAHVSGRIVAVDTDSKATAGIIDAPAGSFVTIDGSGLAWAFDDDEVRVIEPRGVSVLGSMTLPHAPQTVLPDASNNRLVIVSDEGLTCVGGSAAFAWRLGSAIAGSAMIALVALLALRLFGSVLAAGLAALFVAVDGLAFALSRIAMNDSYVTAFALAAWLGALSVLHHLGRGADRPNRRAARLWLAVTGVAGGLAIASKWVGLYALAGIGLLFAWDALRRRGDGILSIAGKRVRSVVLFGALVGIVPLLVYVASYGPYFLGLGHSFGDFLSLQRGMYDYHSGLTATHPYGSPWFGWPFGRSAVWLYLGEQAGRRAEIWTAANPVVFIGGLVAMIAAAVVGWRRRWAAPWVIVLAAGVQYVPWILVGRVTFLYHYLPVVPFLALALGAWLAGGLRADPTPDGWPSRQAMAVSGAAVLAFVALLPILDGWSVWPTYLNGVKDWLGWMFK